MRLVEYYCRFTSWVLKSRRAWHTSVFLIQTALIVFSGVGAFLLRFEFTIPPAMKPALAWGLVAWLATRLPLLRLLGVVGGWRHFSASDFGRLVFANLVCSAVAGLALAAFCPVFFPRSILLIEGMAYLMLSTGVRMATRLSFEFIAQRSRGKRQRTLIYGAGSAGVLLLAESRVNSSFPYMICGFIDDRAPAGVLIQGVKVLGQGKDLARIARRHEIGEVLIAIPSATGSEMREIIARCQAAGIVYRTMPRISEILVDRALARQIRNVAIEDLLGRGSVRLDEDNIRSRIEGRTVLVTGAAGSIGSELCRQIARFRPAVLVGFDISETALFFIEREMREAFPELKFHAEIGSIQSERRLRELFSEYRPSLALHAAAYKHVPMMEKHVFEAVSNNVFGSWNLATIAGEFGVQEFVMISSDKAVNPTSIMGATKRAAELLIRSLQDRGTRYISVRFGNVLGSNGSVIPIFKQQIAAGGPVTITHPEMQRYFMTIPEASQLVLQACSIGHGGEIFVLDMGEPVKIVDLARQLIRLSGLEPDDDIRIEFTGMRPGEKLYEELNTAGEHMLPTSHDKIRIFAGRGLPSDRAAVHLRRLEIACELRDTAMLLAELKSMVPEYSQSQEVTERAFSKNLVTLGKVLEFRKSAARAEAAS